LVELDCVSNKDADTVHAHLSGEISEDDLLALFELDSEKSVGQRLYDNALEDFLSLIRGIHVYERLDSIAKTFERVKGMAGYVRSFDDNRYIGFICRNCRYPWRNHFSRAMRDIDDIAIFLDDISCFSERYA
jgi:hypothetical protein